MRRAVGNASGRRFEMAVMAIGLVGVLAIAGLLGCAQPAEPANSSEEDQPAETTTAENEESVPEEPSETAPALPPTPVTDYAVGRGVSEDLIPILAPLDLDGMDDDERSYVEALAKSGDCTIASLRPITEALFEHNLAEIGTLNLELAAELMKLPDFTTIEVKDVEVLNDVLDFADERTVFGTTFSSILDEGIPDKRQYCSPLRALVWILYDYDRERVEAEKPWDFPAVPHPDPHFGYRKVRDVTVCSMTEFAWAQSSTSKNCTSAEWSTLDKAVGLLNSIDIVGLLPFEYEAGLPGYAPETALRTRKVDCDGIARFRNYCLLANGYPLLDYDRCDAEETAVCGLIVAYSEPVVKNGRNVDGHAELVFTRDGSFWHMSPGGVDKISYPNPNAYDSIEEIADKIAGLQAIYGAGGWKYFQIRDMDWNVVKEVYSE